MIAGRGVPLRGAASADESSDRTARAAVETLFTLAFGHRPAVIASAPGRVNLIGEHVDYNGGAVLPVAIAQRTWVAMRRASGPVSRAVSRDRGETGEWSHGAATRSGSWWDYVAGPLREAEPLGAGRGAYEVAVASDIPMGAGLSSSAALEVATIVAALAVEGMIVEPVRTDASLARRRDIAWAAHRAEHDFVGVSCGIMDQFACALCRAGEALHLQCDTQESRGVPFTRGILIVDTRAPRALTQSAFNRRRAECDAALALLRSRHPTLSALAHATPAMLEEVPLPAPLDRRARHVVNESGRVESFVAVCQGTRDDHSLGALLNASHQSLRDDYECSTPELDWVVDHSVARVGIEGARLTGAGWGGCAIVVGEDAALREFAPELATSFDRTWGRAPGIWLTTPHDGARVEA